MLLLVAACAPQPPVAREQASAGCNAEAVQQFVGQPADATAAEALRVSGAKSLRRYATGDVLTMDYRADRLDVESAANGRIVKLTCG
ncbi:I78 family peptidase inhibitor [Sphingomonas sp.]|uniref:I78 family peptidase inhibitor n=1 Tax=Sphingomonas sp. TaxID=28214 RepID=UPI0035C78C1D